MDNFNKKIQRTLDNVNLLIKASHIATVSQFHKIKHIDYRGNDLIIQLENGRTLLFSAMVNDQTGKATLEFEIS